MVTTLIEAATGLALLVLPAFVVKLLLGEEILGAGIPLGRVAGIALLALGFACWLAGADTKSHMGRGLIALPLLANLRHAEPSYPLSPKSGPLLRFVLQSQLQ